MARLPAATSMSRNESSLAPTAAVRTVGISHNATKANAASQDFRNTSRNRHRIKKNAGALRRALKTEPTSTAAAPDSVGPPDGKYVAGDLPAFVTSKDPCQA